MVERAAPAPTGHFTRRSSSALECHPRYYGLRTQQANGRLGDATLPLLLPILLTILLLIPYDF